MSARPINRSEFFASLFRSVVLLRRKIFTSRVNQTLIALAALAACVGLAVLCWQLHHILAGLLGMVLAYSGLLLAWELLPFSEQTRARWAVSYMSFPWRKALWVGLTMATWRLWAVYVDHKLDPDTVLMPALFAVTGSIAYGIWHLRKRTLQ